MSASEQEHGSFPGRLAVQQRVLPAYRVAFLDALAGACQGGLSVISGEGLAVENLGPSGRLQVARHVPARTIHFFSPSSPLYACYQRGFRSWLEAWQPDVLVVEANSRYLATPAAIRWMHAHGHKVIGWGLGAPPLTGPFTGFQQRSRSRFLNSLDGVIAYSQGGAGQYRNCGIPSSRVFVAANAVVATPDQPPPARPAQFTGRPVVLFVGRLQGRKRVDLLIEACAGLPASFQPELWIVGDGPARQEWAQLAGARYPLTIFYGARHGEQLEDLFNRADLFVLPGTGGLAVQQAMAHGLPVIAAEGDGTLEDLVLPENGWRIPPGDLAALQAALLDAFSDLLHLRQKGNQAYQMILEQVNLDSMVRQFLIAIRSISGEAG